MPMTAEPRQTGLRSEAGMTLVELLVSLALATLIGAMVAGFQMNAGRWHRADQEEVEPLRPIRDAADVIARDTRISAKAECRDGTNPALAAPCSATARLLLHQYRRLLPGDPLHDPSMPTLTYYIKVSYWLDGNQLQRREEIQLPDGTIAARQAVRVRGLAGFTPGLTVDATTGLITSIALDLSAASSDSTPISRRLEFGLVPRLGVLP